VPAGDPLLPSGDGHTPLSDDDLEGLIPTYVATRGELFDAEQANILRGLPRTPPRCDDLLDDKYLRELHRAMFGEVWRWAGRYRLRETSIGVDPDEITAGVRKLVEDVRAWVEYRTYEPDEIALRFHVRLEAIRPFPNGNGRLGRIAANYLVIGLDGAPFSWGAGQDVTTDALRKQYLAALRHGERTDDFAALVSFART
jgi:Fic-DOC domain mobile mystery protein B